MVFRKPPIIKTEPQKEEIIEIGLPEAEHIEKIFHTDGWKFVENWIKKRISLCETKIITGEGDIEMQNVTVQKSDKIDITVVNIDRDFARHEIRTWKLLLQKKDDWTKMVQGGKK